MRIAVYLFLSPCNLRGLFILGVVLPVNYFDGNRKGCEHVIALVNFAKLSLAYLDARVEMVSNKFNVLVV